VITGGGLGQKRNGEFCVTVALQVPGLLAYWPSRLKALVAMGLTCVVFLLNCAGFTLAGLKAYERG